MFLLARKFSVAFFALLIVFITTRVCAANDVTSSLRTDHASVSLLVEPRDYVAGKELKAVVTLISIPGWHTYYKNPGDVGLATRIKWTLPDGVSAGEIVWPEPTRFTQAKLVSYGYEGKVVLSIPLAIAADFTGDLPLHAKVKWLVCAEQCVPEEAELELLVRTASPSSTDYMGLLTALLFAFVGGLILNLMPCVLPVLSIKVFALLGERDAPRGQLAKHGLAFLLGVLVSFWVLAIILLVLQSAGSAIGWGFQLQSPGFVVALAALFTLLGLNFLGVFEMGTSLQGAAGELEQRASRGSSAILGSLSSGVLTTLVATPCTAPFLGAGIGFTLGQSPIYSMMIFTAMGLGVGLPVTLLALSPGWLRYVPRPGAWMLLMKQVFAFPMFATVVWLTWVLGHQLGVDSMGLLLFGLVLISVAGWLWGRHQHHSESRFLKKLLQIIFPLLFLILGLAIAWPSALVRHTQKLQPQDLSYSETQSLKQPGLGIEVKTGIWLPYSESLLNEARHQGHPVFVDFTAAWCLSCQVNKQTSLHADSVAEVFKKLHVVTIEADWTNADPVITQALARLHRNAVPVYAVYPASGGAPELLPEVLTPSLVIGALNTAIQK
jgi:thiol:disulfide interchange protein DsbD